MSERLAWSAPAPRARALLLGLAPLAAAVIVAAGLLLRAAPAWAAPLATEGGGGGLFGLAPLIIVFPVAGLLINAIWGRYLGERWVGIVASGAAGLSFVIAVLQLVGLRANDYAPQIVPIADWIVLGGLPALHVSWALLVDTLSVTMMLVVTGVGTLIHVYAIGYMHEDVRVNGDPGRFPRFFVYLNLFLASMLILVAGDSYLTLFVGWEGVGLCSYLLIGFWFDRGAGQIANARAGRKAFVVNRIGDWAMTLAVLLIFWNFGSLTFREVFPAVASRPVGDAVVVAITLLLLIGATGKSAQIPLYVWLPDAMAGPTPVSALIHAATMVTAGIYMITRSHALYALAPVSQTAVALVGAATALFAGTMGLAQFDIKKVLAYSTISQLGFMVAAIGLGGYVAGMFHLVTHAFFKALLFLSAGSVIHAVEHGHHHSSAAAHAAGGGAEHGAASGAAVDPHAVAHGAATPSAHGEHAFDPQDMRNMGGLWARLPITKWVFLIGGLALAGIVPFAGFWSKDEILLHAFNHNRLVFVLLMVAAFFTAFYVGRQLLMVFFGRARTDAARHAAESPLVMTIPLIILAAGALLGGALNLPTIAGWSPPGAHAMTKWLGHTLEASEAEVAGHAEAETGGEAAAGEAPAEAGAGAEGSLNFQVAGLSTALAVVALGLAYAVYRRQPERAEDRDPLARMLGPVFRVLNAKYYVDEIYHFLFIRPFNWLADTLAYVVDWRFWHDWFHDSVIASLFNSLSRFTAEFVDLGMVDAVISGLPGDFARFVARRFRGLQSGYVRSYALAVFAGVIAVLGYFVLFAR